MSVIWIWNSSNKNFRSEPAKGVFLPKYTVSEINGMSLGTQDNGLLLYNSDRQSLQVWDGTLHNPLNNKPRLQALKAAPQAVTNTTLITNFEPTPIIDNYSTFNITTGIFTAPLTGWYDIKAIITVSFGGVTNTSSFSYQIWNGSVWNDLPQALWYQDYIHANQIENISLAKDEYLLAGNQIRFVGQSGANGYSLQGVQLSITKTD